jgi:hypothetical protein
MKKITMNYKEFNVFQKIANFFYDFSVSKGVVIIEANAQQLESLGY